MSELILVRHGQASFGKKSYDKLSDRGIEQVKLLARHWQDMGERFDCIYSGTLLRQRETAKELLSLVRGEPDKSIENPSLNEYNGDPLMRVYLRDHAASEGRKLDREASMTDPGKDPRRFQEIFEAATAKWIRNELQPEPGDTEFEYWDSFKSRVHGVVDELMARHSGGSKVLISTSGGVIAMALQRVLQFPDEQVITTNWMVKNSSVTRVKYGNGKLSLVLFNSLAHLEKAELAHMVTYR
ncbi:MAG: histidine phosphatase family protein [Proteobacteria bacterium]|nr:histidine phosphatase family protein [Pseudomonadota bacterium]